MRSGYAPIVAPECGYAVGDGGVAVLVLARRVTGMPIMEPRLDMAPADHEDISFFGFGRCPSSPDAIHRRARDVGPTAAVSTAGFVALAALCPGDLGGPVLDSKAALVGVLTTGDLDGDGRLPALARFTRVDAWRRVFAAASAVSRGASATEVPPYGDCPRSP